MNLLLYIYIVTGGPAGIGCLVVGLVIWWDCRRSMH